MAITIIENVPAAEVDKYKRLYRDAGATDIEVRPERDGEFTLVVTTPDRQRHSDLSARTAGPA